VNCCAKSIESPVASTVAQAVLGAQGISMPTSIVARGSKIASGRGAPSDLRVTHHGLPNF
jgi:hypothetical protein